MHYYIYHIYNQAFQYQPSNLIKLLQTIGDKLLLGAVALIALFLNKRILVPSTELLTTVKNIHLALITHAITFRYNENEAVHGVRSYDKEVERIIKKNEYADDIAIQFRDLSAKLEYSKRVILWYPLAKIFFGLPEKSKLNQARKSLIGYSNNMNYEGRDQINRAKKEVIIRRSLGLPQQD